MTTIITKSTGFNYYGRGTITFEVTHDDKAPQTVELSPVIVPQADRFVQLTEHGREFNKAIADLLNCGGDEDETFNEDAYLELMNDVFGDPQFDILHQELLARTISIEELFA